MFLTFKFLSIFKVSACCPIMETVYMHIQRLITLIELISLTARPVTHIRHL